MRLYFAPLEGITDGIYRSAHSRFFGGVEKYFTPFLSPSAGFRITKREKRSLMYDANDTYLCVPQLLTKDSQVFAESAKALCGAGFEEVNLNLGCPSGTVTAEGKGSSMLSDPDALDSFFSEVFAVSDMPRISVKTRIGFESTDSWPAIWRVLSQYPFCEIIVHPRARKEFYRGRTHPESLALCAGSQTKVIYNGDIFSPADFSHIIKELPFLKGVMLGRGLVANPSLADDIRTGEKIIKEKLRQFHEFLWTAYCSEMPFKAAHGRILEIMSYMSQCLEGSRKQRKRMRKAKGPGEYLCCAEALFDMCELRNEPYFDPLFLSSGSSTPVI